MEERWAVQSTLHDCCPRSEPRGHCWDSLVGPGRTLARQASEPRARKVEGGPLRGRPRLRREGVWDEAQRRWHAPQLVAAEMGDPDGVLRLAEPGVVNKGQAAVGGARQSCGTVGQVEPGQVEPGQVGGGAGSASRQG